MEWVNFLLQGIIEVVAWAFGLLYQGFSYLLSGVGVVLSTILWLLLAGILSTISGIINAISFSAVAFNFAGQWAGLPPQAIYIVNAVGLPEFMTVLAGAYAIRFILNLIPAAFTRV